MSRKYSLLAGLLLLAMAISAQNIKMTAKLSPRLRNIVHQQTAEATKRAASNATIDVLAKLTPEANEAALAEKYHFTVLSRIGQVLIIRIPQNRLTDMAADEQVMRIEAERAAQKMLDVVPSQISADKVLGNTGGTLPQAFTGKGTMVGIVDVGFDYTHPVFTDTDWQSRIRWVGDYISTPNIVMTDAADIKKAMFSPDPYELHGTHVAGIAAGKSVMRLFAGENDHPFQGIAQEADIAMGAISLTGDNPILAENSSSSVPALMAFKSIFDYADARQQPCVINFSAGVTQTFANNRQLEEEVIRTLTAQPGHALVVAAGNAGAYPYLLHKERTLPRAGAGIRFISDESLAFFGVEVKMSEAQSLRVRYTDSNYTAERGEFTLKAADIATATGTATRLLGNKTIYADLEEQGDGYAVIYLTSNNQFADTDRLLLTIEGEGEAWMLADVLCAPLENVAGIEHHAIAERGSSIAWPGSMDEVITVGNIGWRYKVFGTYGAGINEEPYEMEKGEGYLAKSSSRGPTVDGRIKPDVCAPGVCVVSAMNNGLGWGLPTATADALEQQYQYHYMGYVDEPENPNFDPNSKADNWNAYHALIVQSGTSMSAPAVTGTIALWMQADPTLTADRIKDIIANSARQPDSELNYPNNLYGYGEIDAYKGLLYLLGLTGIKDISQSQPSQTTFQLDGRMLSVTFANGYQGKATIRVYATDGRLLMEQADTTLNLSALPAGVYAVQVNTGERQTTGSTLIRL